MRFVGLDVAYRHVGVVALDGAGMVVQSQHLQVTHDLDPEGFLEHLALAAETLQPDDVVAIEGLSFGSFGRSHLLAGAHLQWLTAAYMLSRFVVIVVPLRVKIWACDDAKASKRDMIAWAQARLQPHVAKKVSEHEADALALADLARAAWQHARGLPQTLSARQLAILTNEKGTGLLQRPGVSLLEREAL